LFQQNLLKTFAKVTDRNHPPAVIRIDRGDDIRRKIELLGNSFSRDYLDRVVSDITVSDFIPPRHLKIRRELIILLQILLNLIGPGIKHSQ
jgi:hypothetical protein